MTRFERFLYLGVTWEITDPAEWYLETPEKTCRGSPAAAFLLVVVGWGGTLSTRKGA